jgi:hypothetical protein
MTLPVREYRKRGGLVREEIEKMAAGADIADASIISKL